MHASWSTYFSGLDRGMRSQDAFRPPPGLVTLASGVQDGAAPIEFTAGMTAIGQGVVEDHMKVSLVFWLVSPHLVPRTEFPPCARADACAVDRYNSLSGLSKYEDTRLRRWILSASARQSCPRN